MKILPILQKQNNVINSKKTNAVSFNAKISMPNVNKSIGILGTIGLAGLGIQNTLQNMPISSLLKQDSSGNTIFNKVDESNKLLLSDGQFALINERTKESPKILKQLYLTPNNEGILPVQRDMGLNKRKIMHETLKNSPDVLTQMYLKGFPKNIIYKQDHSEFLETLSALKEHTDVINKILDSNLINFPARIKLKDRISGVNLYDNMYTISTIVNLYNDNPEILYKLLSKIDFHIDINNHREIFNMLVDKIPDVLADLYLNDKVDFFSNSWEEVHDGAPDNCRPAYARQYLSIKDQNKIKNDIKELALNSDLCATKSKQLLQKYCQDIDGYDILMSKLNKLELYEFVDEAGEI